MRVGRWRIGSLELESPFILAPLAGITDAPFRRICKEQGAALVFAEMASGKGLCYNSRRTEELLRIYDDEKPVGYQLFGREPEIMAAAAAKLDDHEHAVLDINMGCPVPKVVKNGEGAALLRTPELAAEIVAAVKRSTNRPVTVKIRAGWDENSVNAVEMARILEDAGAAALTVHGRTRAQNYRGDADWDVIRLVKEAVDIPVVGNGDVRSGADAVRMLTETGCDMVMIARGALGNPWIFHEARSLYMSGETDEPVGMAERKRMIIRHLDMLIAEKSESAAVCEMRKHIAWYMKGFRGASDLRVRINKLAEAKRIRDEIQRFS
ncbi:MAG: tRNA dihydrouridine synthase DusB [Clostridiales Family XIII bacterium]|jgi:tRNA-dihydrouridine synthase B|nr:tRNA dihydrouridine synthase DusB [Clostridiales Family XIII bacterium]